MLMRTITIVIPALNEEDVIARTVELIKEKETEARSAGLELEILVVDNGSTDLTADEAKKAGARVVFEPNPGYGHALRRGFAEAKGDIVAMGDADLTYPLEDFVEFVQPITRGDSDVVIGNRYHPDIEPGALKSLNKMGGRVLSMFGNALFGTHVRDWHCGMRAFTKEALKAMNLQSGGMELASEIVIKCALGDLKVEQTNIKYRRRLGTSKLHVLRDGARHVSFIALSYFRWKRDSRPVVPRNS